MAREQWVSQSGVGVGARCCLPESDFGDAVATMLG